MKQDLGSLLPVEDNSIDENKSWFLGNGFLYQIKNIQERKQELVSLKWLFLPDKEYSRDENKSWVLQMALLTR